MTDWKRLSAAAASLCLTLGLLSTFAVRAQGEVTVSIDAPAEVAEGSDFIARVNITGVTNLDAANYDVTFDPAVLEITNVTDGLIDGTAIPVDMWGVIAPGTIRVIHNVPGLSGVSGSGCLAEIHFNVVGSAGDASALNLSNGVLSDTSANEIPATWVGDSVDINTVLDAEFSANVIEGVAGATEFAFTDKSTGGTPPYTYQWDFGDTGTSTLQNPTHVYANTGTYTVTLNVTDDLSGINAEIKAAYITVYESLDAAFSANVVDGVAAVTVFSFTDETSGGKTPHSYQWDFGDSGTSTSQNPTHVYASAGTYTVTLAVTDGLSTTSTETKTGYIRVYDSGDANKDGSVNSLDITKVERIIMMLDDETPGADANNDGNANALDITRIEQIIMGG